MAILRIYFEFNAISYFRSWTISLNREQKINNPSSLQRNPKGEVEKGPFQFSTF